MGFLVLVTRDFVFARDAFAGRDFFAPDFFAVARVAFPGRIDFTMRFAAGAAARAVFATTLAPWTACRATRLTAGIIGLSLSARFPTAAPITPPTTAPTGPPTAPITAPVAAPAAVFEIGGISMFSFDPDCDAEDFDLFAIGFVCFWPKRSGRNNRVIQGLIRLSPQIRLALGVLCFPLFEAFRAAEQVFPPTVVLQIPIDGGGNPFARRVQGVPIQFLFSE